MICDRAERRVGGTSAPVFGGGFLGFPRKVGYLIGGILSPSSKNGLMIGSADSGCAARFFVGLPCRAALPRFAAPPPFWGSGVARSVILSGGFLSPSRKNGFMIGAADGGRAARLFVGLTLPGSSPPLRGSAAFLGAAGLQGRFNYRGDFISLPQKWRYDRGRQTAAAPLDFLSG